MLLPDGSGGGRRQRHLGVNNTRRQIAMLNGMPMLHQFQIYSSTYTFNVLVDHHDPPQPWPL